MWNGNKLIDSKRNNSDIETYRAELNLFVTLNEKQDLKAKVYLFDSERGLPGGVIYDNPYAAERLYDRNYFGQLKYENRFSENGNYKQVENLTSAGTGTIIMNLPVLQTIVSARLRLTYPLPYGTNR